MRRAALTAAPETEGQAIRTARRTTADPRRIRTWTGDHVDAGSNPALCPTKEDVMSSAVTMTLDESRRESVAELLAFVPHDSRPAWGFELLCVACGMPAGMLRRHLGHLYGEGRVVPIVHEGAILWRRPGREEAGAL